MRSETFAQNHSTGDSGVRRCGRLVQKSGALLRETDKRMNYDQFFWEKLWNIGHFAGIYRGNGLCYNAADYQVQSFL